MLEIVFWYFIMLLACTSWHIENIMKITIMQSHYVLMVTE